MSTRSQAQRLGRVSVSITQPNRRNMFDLLVKIIDLIRVWWRHDQIACSPEEGRWLRLEPNSVLLVGGVSALVTRRVVGRKSGGGFVYYECESRDGPCTLTIHPQQQTACWKCGSQEREYEEGDIEVFPAGPSRGTMSNCRSVPRPLMP